MLMVLTMERGVEQNTMTEVLVSRAYGTIHNKEGKTRRFILTAKGIRYLTDWKE